MAASLQISGVAVANTWLVHIFTWALCERGSGDEREREPVLERGTSPINHALALNRPGQLQACRYNAAAVINDLSALKWDIKGVECRERSAADIFVAPNTLQGVESKSFLGDEKKLFGGPLQLFLFTPFSCCCLFFYVLCQELQITPCAVLFPHKYFSARLLLAAESSQARSSRRNFSRQRKRAAAIDFRDRRPEVLKKTLSISWIGSPHFFCLWSEKKKIYSLASWPGTDWRPRRVNFLRRSWHEGIVNIAHAHQYRGG